MKKFLSLSLALVLLLALAACGGAGTETQESITIGVIQFAPHPSLDNCFEGFKQGLIDEGYVDGQNLNIVFENAMGEPATADSIAKSMVASGVDMICAIATPAAMSAYSATRDTAIPVIFSAVSDPVSAGLVSNPAAPDGHATGTSDLLNFPAQLQLIRDFLPDATTIGVLYTTSEPNSVAHLAEFQTLAAEYGFTVESVGITSSADVAAGAQNLMSKGIDCVNNFTDNNVVNNLSQLLFAANEANIPVFGSEVEQVVNGCLASESLDYVALGTVTAGLAARVIHGAAPEEVPVEYVLDSTPVYNSKVADALGISIPEREMEQVD